MALNIVKGLIFTNLVPLSSQPSLQAYETPAIGIVFLFLQQSTCTVKRYIIDEDLFGEIAKFFKISRHQMKKMSSQSTFFP